MTAATQATPTEQSATVAWSSRVRRVGGLIQAAFAAFWLVRGSLAIGHATGAALAAGSSAVVGVVFAYAIVVTAGKAPRPTSPEGKRIERAISVATIVQLVASFAAPAIVLAAGHPDWVLPSVALTIGPLLLWLDHCVHIPRYQPMGWTLIVGAILLPVTASGNALTATTGVAAGILMLSTATAGFHDLSSARQDR